MLLSRLWLHSETIAPLISHIQIDHLFESTWQRLHATRQDIERQCHFRQVEFRSGSSTFDCIEDDGRCNRRLARRSPENFGVRQLVKVVMGRVIYEVSNARLRVAGQQWSNRFELASRDF
jgi:hypothetical protein